jgi:hypothetical protein
VEDNLKGKVGKLAHWMDKMLFQQQFIIKQAVKEQLIKDGESFAERKGEGISYKINEFVLVTYPDKRPTKLHANLAYRIVGIDMGGHELTIQNIVSLTMEKVHISRLRKYYSSSQMLDRDAALRDKEEWDIEKIIKHNGVTSRKKDMDFLVRFKGLESSADRWYTWIQLVGNIKLYDYLRENNMEKLIPRQYMDIEK